MGNYFGRQESSPPQPVLPAPQNTLPPNAKTSIIKITLSGVTTVGKTSLLMQYTQKQIRSFLPTVGLDFLIHPLVIAGEEYRLQIWDTCGQERYRAIARATYRGASIVLVVFALDDEWGFQGVESYIQSCYEHSPPNVICALVANKRDLERKVSKQKVSEVLKKYPLVRYFETNAKEHENVQEMFDKLAYIAVLGEAGILHLPTQKMLVFAKKLMTVASWRDVTILT